MNISQYIIIKGTKRNSYSTYRTYTSRMTMNSPALKSDEVAVKVSIELPDALFERTALQANIKVPNDVVSQPVITADVIDNVQEIIKQNTGFDVKLQIIDKEEAE